MSSSLRIRPLAAFNDNYIWVVDDGTSAVVIDPGAAQPVLDWLARERLVLTSILLTHAHADHQGGVLQLISQWPEVVVIDNFQQQLADGQQLQLPLFESLEVITTPGHTREHVCYLVNGCHLFCGDSLFSLGCGRVFTNDYTAAYTSLLKLKKLPAATYCYPAHEYSLTNLQFTLCIDPKADYYRVWQQQLAAKLEQGLPSLPVLLADEFRYNLFLRCQDGTVQALVAKVSESVIDTELACFVALRQLRNNF